MTSPEILKSELNAYAARRDAKFAEICSLLREKHGMGEPDLSDGQRSEIKTEAEDCIETWQVKHMGRSQANLV